MVAYKRINAVFDKLATSKRKGQFPFMLKIEAQISFIVLIVNEQNTRMVYVNAEIVQ